MSRGSDDYSTKPIVGWTWSEVDQFFGKWGIRLPLILAALAFLLTGTFYSFFSVPANLLINGGGRMLGGAGRSAVDGIKPVMDSVEQGSQFGKQGGDDRLQQQDQ